MLRNKNGFTLLEIMMVVAILGIFITIVYGYLGHNLKVLDQKNDDSNSYFQARTAMLRLSSELNQYQKIEIEDDTENPSVKHIEVIPHGKKDPIKFISIDTNGRVLKCNDCKYSYDAESRTLTKEGHIIASNIDLHIDQEILIIPYETEEGTKEEEYSYLKIIVTAYSNHAVEETMEFSTMVRLDRNRPLLRI